MQNKNNSSLLHRVTLVLWVAFVLAAVPTAYLSFVTVRDVVASWTSTGGLPGLALATATATPPPNATTAPATTPQPQSPTGVEPTPEPWDGASRVNILVMGLDYRDWQSNDGPPRTDTMMLVSIDPRTNSVGILSIPRDLWVNIPGYGYAKINQAYQVGEALQLPGGGPGLAMQTVESVIGVPVDYYAVIDFSAFVRFIDEIDGVKIYVPEPITIDLIGSGASTKKKLEPGWQTLPGDFALAYARARNTEGGDFDRAQRQQQVILAIRDRILEFNMIPKLLKKAPKLYQELSSGIRTNLDFDQARRLALLVINIPRDNIRHGIIGPEQVIFAKSPNGLDILKPIPDEIRRLRDEVFASSLAQNPALANLSSQEKMQQEGAKLRVLNGTYTTGLAQRTADYLTSLGAQVIAVGNADQVYRETTVIDYTGNPYTIAYLVEILNINPNRIYNNYAPTSEVDVDILLGTDWATSNSLP